MLHALGVGFRRLPGRADGDEEVYDYAMAGARGVSELAPGFGEKQAPIGTGGDEPRASASRCF